MGDSRTRNVTRNIYFATICQIVNLIVNFISRTVFIRILGAEYLGVNGLFTNILTILSFAELGIGNAIIFSMYKPLALNDYKKINSLMALYKKAYHTIGFFVGVIGITLVPFLGFIIKEKPDIIEDIRFIYILFLANTTLSYFFIYKKSIIIADQKSYIVSVYAQIIQIIRTVIQLIVLVVNHGFISYLIIQIIFTFLENYMISRKADRMYPYLKEKDAEQLPPNERISIFNNIKALAMYKFGSVILNGTANIMISALMGVRAVGIVSNYLLIIAALNSLLGQVTSSFTASVGNLNAIESVEKKERVFHKIFFIILWIYGFASMGLLLFINPLINIWIGEEFILPNMVVFAIVLHFYVNAAQFTAFTYRTTTGLFTKGKWAPLIAAVINIILSLVLGSKFGLAGIFFATSIARLVTTSIVDPVLIYKYIFNKSSKPYFIKYFGYTMLYGVIYVLLKYTIGWINISNLFTLIFAAVLMTIIFNFIMIIVFYRTNNFKELVSILKKMMSRKFSVMK